MNKVEKLETILQSPCWVIGSSFVLTATGQIASLCLTHSGVTVGGVMTKTGL